MSTISTLRPLLAAPLLAVLAGCSILGGGSREPVTIYAPRPALSVDPAWPKVDWQLAVSKPNAARIIDSPRINVRPTPGELQVYQGATWAQPATDMLEDTLVRAFEDSGKIAGVARIAAGIRSDYKLSLDLRRFESDYAGQALPSATIELSAKLLHSVDQRVVASRTFTVAQPAAATDVTSVATAFDQALGTLTRDVVGWTLLAGQQDAQAHPRLP